MPLVSVWKCPQSGKLFENKSKYFKHLRKLALDRRIQRTKTVFQNEFASKVLKLRMCSNEQEIINWIENNSKTLALNDLWCNRKHLRNVDPDKLNAFRIKIKAFGLDYQPHMSPLNGRPGWYGHLEYGISERFCGVGFNDLWRGTGIQLGPGSNWHDFEHDGIKYQGMHFYVRLAADDWPAMKMYRALTLDE